MVKKRKLKRFREAVRDLRRIWLFRTPMKCLFQTVKK